jgi:hypothetical protein
MPVIGVLGAVAPKRFGSGGFGNFSSIPGETDMILRNSNTGGLEVDDIRNNQITNAAFMGTVGLEWQGTSPLGRMERRRFDVLADDDAIVRRDALAGTKWP